MLKLLKECTPWLNWKTAALAGLVVVGLIVCTGLPTLGVLAGIAPMLLIAACLVPCLAPLILLRRKGQEAKQQNAIPLVKRPGREASACSCGQESCSVGGAASCASEQRAIEMA